MRRLLRHLVAVLARALHALGDRLRPPAVDAGPALADSDAGTAAEAGALASQCAGGPPAHWLALVARRAPGLHVSLQERGVVGRPVSARDTTHVIAQVLPAAPVAHAPQAAGRAVSRRTARAEAAAAVALARAETERLVDPARSLGAAIPGGPEADGAAADSDAEAPRPAGQVHSDADTIASRIARRRAALADGWPMEPTPALPAVVLPAAEVTLPVRPAPAPRPLLRPLSLRDRSVPSRGQATPFFAPARDEDIIAAQIPRLPRPHRGLSPGRVANDLPDDAALPCFPALPDELAPAPAVHRFGWAEAPAARLGAFGAGWPSLQRAAERHAGDEDGRRHAGGEGGRWPELHGEEPGGGDPGMGAPDGHRARLAREQRGIPWNG